MWGRVTVRPERDIKFLQLDLICGYEPPKVDAGSHALEEQEAF